MLILILLGLIEVTKLLTVDTLLSPYNTVRRQLKYKLLYI